MAARTGLRENHHGPPHCFRAFVVSLLVPAGNVDGEPRGELRGPRQDKKLPHFLGEDALVQLVAAPDDDGILARRDRAILETLYVAGLRVSELTGLDIDDLDLDAGTAIIRGKGRRNDWPSWASRLRKRFENGSIHAAR